MTSELRIDITAPEPTADEHSVILTHGDDTAHATVSLSAVDRIYAELHQWKLDGIKSGHAQESWGKNVSRRVRCLPQN